MKIRHVEPSAVRQMNHRLDAAPYAQGFAELRDRLGRMSFDRLEDLTDGHSGGIYTPPIHNFKRNYVFAEAHGVPFIGTSTMMHGDLTGVRLLSRRDATSPKLAPLRLQQGMTLVSCSGTIGRVVYARPGLAGVWSSGDILKIVPDQTKVDPGYLFAFLSSRHGRKLLTTGTYGSVIRHIEREHAAGLPIPRLGEDVERRCHEMVQAAAAKIDRFGQLTRGATNALFGAVGVDDITAEEWHAQGPELAWTEDFPRTHSLRALNYSPRVGRLLAGLRSAPWRPLGDICAGGKLGTGARFRRIGCEPEHGLQLVGQKQGFWLRPEGRWISPKYTPPGVMAADETVLVASAGTLGEWELYCRPILATGSWLNFAFTQHFFRVVSGDDSYSGAYLFALLRSETAFRCLRAMSMGSKQQEIRTDLVAQFPVPVLTAKDRLGIAEQVRVAHRLRDEAVELENGARKLVENAIDGRG